MGALPEFQAVDPDGHRAVRVDAQELVRLLVRLQLGAVATARGGGPHRAGRSEAEGEAGGAGELDEPAAADALALAGARLPGESELVQK